MSAAVDALFLGGLVAYSVAATLHAADLSRREGEGVARRAGPWVLGAGAALHAGHVVAASLLTRVCPVESVHFALSLAGLILVAAFLVVRRTRRIDALGAVVAPVALTFLVGAQFVSQAQPADSVPRGLLAIHVTANLAGVGLFLLAAAAGAFYLVQERGLRSKRSGRIAGKLPPLEALDWALHRLLLGGFLLLTLGIASGSQFTSPPAHGLVGIARLALAYGTWVLAAAVLALRAIAGWRGRRAAWGTIAGAVCVSLVVAIYVAQPGGLS
ncbi:MAG: cytochrome c biogenesis protein CcsA [Polyangiaceae bacterium]|nr:cytochrome c biogenesis protein CcsA [Polyangiaceae bacterium]